MKLENLVCNLQLAKRLKELGVKQDSFFYWVDLNFGGARGALKPYPMYYQQQRPWDVGDLYSDHWLAAAFSVAELGEMLKEAGPDATIKAYGDLHGFKGTGSIGSIGMLWLLTQPDRLARMLIYLLENKLIPPQ